MRQGRVRKSLLGMGATALMLAAAASMPAQAAAPSDAGDCNIYGPEYIAEVIDCAKTILTLLVEPDPI